MTKFTQMAANEDANSEDGGSRRRIHLREISGDADAPLETVGQDLRAARIRRGDDLAAVSRALKIRKDHLDALEGDRLEDLPGKTYAIGFVRTYARYLGLDVNVLVDRFKAEISGRGEDHAMPSGNLHDDEGRRLPYGWRILAGVIVVALAWGVWHIFFAARDTAPPVPPPPTLARITEPSKPAAPEPQAGSPPAAQATVPVQLPPPPAAQTPSAATPPKPNPVTATQATAAAPGPAVPQSNEVIGEQNRQDSRVVLRARGATRITIKGADGRMLVNRDLAPGAVYYVPNQPGLIMALSNAGAVEAAIDGRPLGPVGQEGQVVGRVSLDPASLTDRYNGR